MLPLCNLHTHTTYCDGDNTPEELVASALSSNLFCLGFSGHAPYGDHDTEGCLTRENIGSYRSDIQKLKSRYADKIEILLGIEQDYYSPSLDYEYDYVIGSVHYVKKNGVYIAVDYSYEKLKDGVDRCFDSDAILLCKEYYRTVADVVNKTNCDIIGHFDIVTKFNQKHPLFDENDEVYRNIALEATDALLESERIFEVNTGAMPKWRDRPYPSDFIIRHIVEKNGRLMITSDAHNMELLTHRFEDTVEYLKFLGVREIWCYRNGKYRSISL